MKRFNAVVRVLEAGQSKTIYQQIALLNGLIDCVRCGLSLKAKHKLLDGVNRNSLHLILTTRVLVLCTVLLYSTHSLQFVFTRSVLYCGWTLHFKLRIYFVHLFYRLRGQQVFRKYLNNLILEY